MFIPFPRTYKIMASNSYCTGKTRRRGIQVHHNRAQARRGLAIGFQRPSQRPQVHRRDPQACCKQHGLMAPVSSPTGVNDTAALAFWALFYFEVK